MSSTARLVPGPGLLRRLSKLAAGAVRLQPLQGDISPRRYLRADLGGRSSIVALYPETARAAFDAFLRSTEILERGGVRAPRILELDEAEGWMLLEDLGPRTLWSERARPWPELEPFLAQAREIARRVADLPADRVAELNPPLALEIFRRELDQTRRLFFASPLFAATPADLEQLAALLDELCRRLDAAPRLPVHRDFMARNLALPNAAPESLVVLDHQDLRLGPTGYDVSSLLNDSLLSPEPIARRLVDGLDPELYHRAAAQRGLKIVGTFLAFAERGSRRYLDLVRPSYERALDHLARLPELSGGTTWLAETWSPSLIRFDDDGAPAALVGDPR